MRTSYTRSLSLSPTKPACAREMRQTLCTLLIPWIHMVHTVGCLHTTFMLSKTARHLSSPRFDGGMGRVPGAGGGIEQPASPHTSRSTRWAAPIPIGDIIESWGEAVSMVAGLAVADQHQRLVVRSATDGAHEVGVNDDVLLPWFGTRLLRGCLGVCLRLGVLSGGFSRIGGRLAPDMVHGNVGLSRLGKGE